MYLFYSMDKINILIYILILLFIGLLVYYFYEKGKSLEGMTNQITYGSIPYKIYINNDENVKYYVQSTPTDGGNIVQFSENISDAGFFYLSTVTDGSKKYSIMVTSDKEYVLRFDGSSLLVKLDQITPDIIDQFSVNPFTPAILNNDKEAIQSKLLKKYLISNVVNTNVKLKDDYFVDFYVDFKYKLEMGETLAQYTNPNEKGLSKETVYSPNGEYYLYITSHSVAYIQKINISNGTSPYFNLYKKQNPFPLNYSNNNLVDTEFFRGQGNLYKDINIHCDSSCSFDDARMVMGGDGNLVIIPNDDGSYADVAWMSGTQFFEKGDLKNPFNWTSPNGALNTINSLFTIYAQPTNDGGLGIFLENTSKTINVTNNIATGGNTFTLGPTKTASTDILLRKFVPNKNSFREALSNLPNTKGYQNMIPESGEICLIKIMPKTSPPNSGTTLNGIDVNNNLCEWITVKTNNTEDSPETTYMSIIIDIIDGVGDQYDVIAMYYGPNNTIPYQMNGWVYNSTKIQPNIKNCPAPVVKKSAPRPAPVVKKSAPPPAPVVKKSAPAPAPATVVKNTAPAPAPATVVKKSAPAPAPSQYNSIIKEIDSSINSNPFTIHYTDIGSKKYIQLDPSNDTLSNNTRILYTTIKANATKFYFHKITSPNMTMILNEDKTYFLRKFGALNLDNIDTQLGNITISNMPGQIDFGPAKSSTTFDAISFLDSNSHIFYINYLSNTSPSPSPIESNTTPIESNTTSSPSPIESNTSTTNLSTTFSDDFTGDSLTFDYYASSSPATASLVTPAPSLVTPATSDSHQKQCNYTYGLPLLNIHHSNVNKVLK